MVWNFVLHQAYGGWKGLKRVKFDTTESTNETNIRSTRGKGVAAGQLDPFMQHKPSQAPRVEVEGKKLIRWDDNTHTRTQISLQQYQSISRIIR